MSSDYFAYLSKALNIYEGMADTGKVLAKGLEPHPALWKPHGGIFIALRHPSDVSEKFAERSAEIAAKIPTMSYTADKLHTSFPTTPQIMGFTKNADTTSALEAVCRGVKQAFPLLQRPSISYFGLRLTPDAVITAGIPDEEFYHGAQTVKTLAMGALKEVNLAQEMEGRAQYALNMGFGPHMTINRWLTPANAAEIHERKLLDSLKPISMVSKPTSLVVGYWQTDFNLKPALRDWTIVEEFTF